MFRNHSEQPYVVLVLDTNTREMNALCHALFYITMSRQSLIISRCSSTGLSHSGVLVCVCMCVCSRLLVIKINSLFACESGKGGGVGTGCPPHTDMLTHLMQMRPVVSLFLRLHRPSSFVDTGKDKRRFL